MIFVKNHKTCLMFSIESEKYSDLADWEDNSFQLENNKTTLFSWITRQACIIET